MAYSPVPVETFGGLNLNGDPGEVGWGGAVDLLNIDFDRQGAIGSRSGYARFNTVQVAGNQVMRMAPFYKSSGSTTLLASFITGPNHLKAYDTTGAVVATATPSVFVQSFARVGTPSAQRMYACDGSTNLYRWDGTAFTTVAAPANYIAGFLLAVTPWDNRLVSVSGSRVQFSDPGAPETFGVNNFIDLTPGDGEIIGAAVVWSNQVFLFKSNRFFIVYATSTDSGGNPIFNYRTVEAPIQIMPGDNQAAVATPHGIYLWTQSGLYVTTGGEPTRVSTPVDPLFTGRLSALYTGSAWDRVTTPALAWWDNKLLISYSENGVSNTKTLVYMPETQQWSIWDIGATAFSTFQFAADNRDDLVFGTAPGGTPTGWIYRHRHTPDYTTDDGAAITSRYRSGFSDLGSTQRKRVREWILEGSGSPTFKTSVDFGSLETGAAVTLGTSPAVAEGRRRYATRGRHFSWQVGGTTAWSLNNLTAHVDEKRAPGTHA